MVLTVKSSTQPGVKPIRRRLVVKVRRSSAEYSVTDAEGVVGSQRCKTRNSTFEVVPPITVMSYFRVRSERKGGGRDLMDQTRAKLRLSMS